MTILNQPPSSALRAPSPRGEKGRAAHLASSKMASSWNSIWGRARAASLPFSPTGRRWPEGSDEGVRLHDEDITKRRPGKTQRARRLRHDETEEEYRLWSDLRGRHLNGFKFARQIPLGPYVVDFLCRERHLIVELDGIQHAESRSDIVRTRWLNEHGYTILRFWNHEVLQERQTVLATIVEALEGRLFERDDALRFHPAIRLPEDRSK